MAQRVFRPGGFALSVKRSRTGLGLFAAEPIRRHACVIEYVGVKVPKDQIATSRSRYLFEIGPRKTIDGSPRWNRARYINHSCAPNCEAWIYRARIFIFSLRRIEAGEELTYDYGADYMKEWLDGTCLCPKCAAR